MRAVSTTPLVVSEALGGTWMSRRVNQTRLLMKGCP